MATYFITFVINRPDLETKWSLNRIMTLYYQRTISTILSDPELQKKIQFQQWAKSEAAEADPTEVKNLVLKGLAGAPAVPTITPATLGK